MRAVFVLGWITTSGDLQCWTFQPASLVKLMAAPQAVPGAALHGRRLPPRQLPVNAEAEELNAATAC